MHYQGLSRRQRVAQTATGRSSTPNYRYPSERWLLLITLLIIGAALLFSRALSLQGLAIFFVVGTVINYFLIRSYIEGLKRDAIQVSDTQFPELKALLDECRRHVDIPPDTRLFVSYSPYMNAFAIGLGRPYSIMLFSALVDHLDADELKYVISHEMGHIKFGHTIWLTLIGQLGRQTYGLPLIGSVYRFFFLLWRRAAELTADRAGLVGCGHLDKAVSSMVKFGAGPWLARWVDSKALAKQARQSNGNFFAAFSETWASHPLMTTRIRRLINFATSERFYVIRPDARRSSSSRRTDSPSEPASQKKLDKSTRKRHERRVIRRLTRPGRSSQPVSMLSSEIEMELAAEVSDDGPSSDADNLDVSPNSATLDWSKAIGFNRLNVSAIRANAEQAEMWLRLGELLQSYGQADEATLCLQRAQGLVTNSVSSAPADPFSLQHRDLSLAVGLPQPVPLASPAASSCSTCGTVNPPGTHYCYQCQFQLQKPCLQCQTWLPAGYANCFSCGQNQAQIITALKAEAKELRKIAQQPLIPRGLTKWEIIFGSIFLADALLVILTLAWKTIDTAPDQARLYFAGAIVMISVGVIVAIIWTRSRARRYWRLFDKLDLATHRYNDIADLLARQGVPLEPARIAPHDPWRWAYDDWSSGSSL
jgi:Zn-dependent protease with chaperone function